MIYQDGEKKYWEYVCHVPDASAANAQVVLRASDGTTRVVPATEVGDRDRPYALVTGAGAEPPAEALKEVLQNCRHISNIRFLALPVFFTAFAVLAKEFAGNAELPDRALIPYVGIGLSLGFAVFETVLSFNLISWWQRIQAQPATSAWRAAAAHRSELALWAARLALFAPYPFALAYWMQKLHWIGTGRIWSDALLLSLPSVLVWVYASYWRNKT